MFRSVVVEVEHDRGVDAEVLEKADPVRQRRDELRRAAVDDGARVVAERHDDRLALPLAREAGDLVEHVAMADVDAVEDAERDDGPPDLGRPHLLERKEPAHRARGQPAVTGSTGDLETALELVELLLVLRPVGGPHLRHEQDAVEVIDLVLEDPGVEVLRLELDSLAVEVERRDPDLLRPEDVPPDPGERKAALLAPLAARLACVISGFTRTETGFSAVRLREQEPDAPAHLRAPRARCPSRGP